MAMRGQTGLPASWRWLPAHAAAEQLRPRQGCAVGACPAWADPLRSQQSLSPPFCLLKGTSGRQVLGQHLGQLVRGSVLCTAPHRGGKLCRTLNRGGSAEDPVFVVLLKNPGQA